MTSTRKVIAIDNGLNGGLVQLDEAGAIVGRMIMPNKVEDGKNRVDELELALMLLHLPADTVVIIEKPVGSKSLSAATSMADSYARTRAACTIAGFEVHSIAARTWQSKLFHGVEGKDTKEKAAKVFGVLFPDHVDEFSTTRKGNNSKNLHDGLADAALIAKFAQATNYKETK
jgi:hypothetical protein